MLGLPLKQQSYRLPWPSIMWAFVCQTAAQKFKWFGVPWPSYWAPPGGIEACIFFATQQGPKLELKVEGFSNPRAAAKTVKWLLIRAGASVDHLDYIEVRCEGQWLLAISWWSACSVSDLLQP